ncbi:MAG: GNAT family N-acetyltransferase [Treponema sp.]|nr:GNAT family N-acetyltransferase [Treponema sp.]
MGKVSEILLGIFKKLGYNGKVNADSITKENVVFFFNKYKFNSDLIFHLERRILKESYDYKKWEVQRAANSELTRRVFRENQHLLEEYIQPAIRNPEQLSLETLQAFLLHTTFFLFENNIDTYVVDDLINAILCCKDVLNDHLLFSCYMNLGISRTVLISGTFEETIELFEKALALFPTQESCGDDTTRIHQVFCRTYEMLAFCLYKSNDYRRFLEIYERTAMFLKESSDELCSKMWSPTSDFHFHIEYLLRFFRIYGIFAAGQNDFKVGINSENKGLENEGAYSSANSFIGASRNANEKALDVIKGWLKEEYLQEEKEGEVNLMIFTYYHMLQISDGEKSIEEVKKIFAEKFISSSKEIDSENTLIFPDLAFPDDGDPVDPKFSKMLDKMKLFNSYFSYNYVFLFNYLRICDDKKQCKRIIQHIVSFYEKSHYADKGFRIDYFIIDLIKLVAHKIDNENDFMLFVQSIFIHRQISSAIHFGMVSSLAGICLYHVIQEKPELSIIPGLFSTRQEVIENRIELLRLIKNAALLHDIGKIGVTNIINLQFRPITKNEYERIKRHPSIGKEIISGIDYLEEYEDFIEGHHKFWNDEGGYPENYKCYASPYKMLVNLVSICDMIDTVTDTMGRNYSVQKTFDEVMEELKKGSGNRYCPELVDVIVSSSQLKKELKKILSVGRNLNSFKTYQNFVQPNMYFSSQDEKHIVPYLYDGAGIEAGADSEGTNVSASSGSLREKIQKFYKFCFEKTPDQTLDAHLAELLDRKCTRAFVMQNKNEEIFGVFIGHIVTPLFGEEPYYYIDEILVRKGYRRLGYGTEMLIHATEKLKEEGIKQLKVSTYNDFTVETFLWIAGFSQSNQYLMEKKI